VVGEALVFVGTHRHERHAFDDGQFGFDGRVSGDAAVIDSDGEEGGEGLIDGADSGRRQL
jgi:hypothetical protein